MSTNVALLILLNLIMFFTCVSSTKTTLPPKRTSNAHSIPAIVPGNNNNNNNQRNGNEKCPKDTLKFGACGSWLGLVTEVIGTKPSEECCTLVKGIADLEAALCLCTVIKTRVLGIVTVNAPIALSLLVNGCGKKIPDGFVCA